MTLKQWPVLLSTQAQHRHRLIQELQLLTWLEARLPSKIRTNTSDFSPLHLLVLCMYCFMWKSASINKDSQRNVTMLRIRLVSHICELSINHNGDMHKTHIGYMLIAQVPPRSGVNFIANAFFSMKIYICHFRHFDLLPAE